MTKPTIEALRHSSDRLEKISDETLQIFIDDAFSEVECLGVPIEYHKRLTRYLALHEAIVSLGNNISKEAIGSLVKEYFECKNDFQATIWGQRYLRWKDQLLGGKLGV